MSGMTGPKGRAREVYDAVLAELKAAGLPEPTLTAGGKHYKLHIIIGARTRTITLPRSPSDPRAAIIKVGDVRRLLQSEGVLR